MDLETKILFDLGAVLILALIGGTIFRKLKLPTVIGIILIGIIVSPFTPGYAIDREEISLFAQIGAILLMFVLGLQFENRHFQQFGPKAFAMAGIAGITVFLAGVFLGNMLGWGRTGAFLLGALLVSTSTTIALKMQSEMGLDRTKAAKLTKASIVIDDLFGFMALALVYSEIGIAKQGYNDLIFSASLMLFSVIAIFYIGVKIVPKLFGMAERLFPGSALTIGTAFCLILSYGVVYFNISPVLGAFLAGTILTSSISYRDVLKSIIPLRNLFASFFFISIGLSLDPNLLISILPLALIITVIAIAAKGLPVALFLLREKVPLKESLQLAATTGPRGEVPLIIAQTVVLEGIVESAFLSIATSLVLLTAVISPLLILAIDKYVPENGKMKNRD